MKKVLFIIFGVICIIVVFVVGYFLGRNYQMVKKEEPVPTITIGPSPQVPTISQIVIPTENVSISPTIASTIAPTIIQESDESIIKKLFAQKSNHKVEDVELTISKNTGTHAQGGVSFAGEMGGGWWLAAKDAGAWKIVQDGNGTISCSIIAPYNFPVDMVPECYDDASQQLITR